jgi:hypothetical protein
MSTLESPTSKPKSEDVVPFPVFLEQKVNEEMAKMFPNQAADDSPLIGSIAKQTIKAMRSGSQRGLLDSITEQYVKLHQYEGPEAVGKTAPAMEPAEHPHSPAFGKAFDKLAVAVEETREKPTRPMKARLAKGLSTFGGILERNLNEGMAYAVPAASMLAGAGGALTGALMGFAANDPTVLYTSLVGGMGVAVGGLYGGMEQGMNPNSRFRKMTAGLKAKCEQPFNAIQAKAKEQGRDWSVSSSDLGDPEPKREVPEQGMGEMSRA